MSPGIGPVALVTGGGTGIGRAICERLAAGGAKAVFINYSQSGNAAAEVAASIQANGATGVPVHADITDPSAVRAMVARVAEEAGRLDHLVNNAGTTELVPFDDLDAITAEVWDRTWRTNVLGTFEVSRAAAPLLRAASGSIVNIGSVAGRRAVGSSIPYGVTKAGVGQLTRALATALAPEVRVNCVSAGTVTTRWHQRLLGSGTFERRALQEAQVVPLRRLAGPNDIAESVVALLGMPFVTGEDLWVDGGKSLLY